MMLRPAHFSEAQSLAEMSRELIEAGLDWRYTPRRLAALINHRETVVLVAIEPSRIQGFAAMQFGDERAHLSLLCVQRDRQRRGIGRRLHEWLLESARVAGIAAVELELRADNAAAHSFYRSAGYSETGLVPGYYDGQIAARRMVLRLRQEASAPRGG